MVIPSIHAVLRLPSVRTLGLDDRSTRYHVPTVYIEDIVLPLEKETRQRAHRVQ